MKYLCLLFFSCGLIHAVQSLPFKRNTKVEYFQIKLSPANQKSIFYKAMITGDKRELKPSRKQYLKSMGLMHLLTPSGIHLSSLFFLKFLSPRFLIPVYLFFLLLFMHYPSYQAISRVVLFKLIYLFFPKMSLNTIFIATFLLAFLLGQYQQNPLSYLFSLTFWGIILIFRERPMTMSLHLSLATFIINSLMDIPSHPLLFLINPLITASVSMLYPFFFANALLPIQLQLDITWLFESLFWLLERIDMFRPIIIPIPMLLALYLIKNTPSFLAGVLLVYPFNLNRPYSPKPMPSRVINPPSMRELVLQKKDTLHFLDRSCRFDLSCRELDIHFGGYRL